MSQIARMERKLPEDSIYLPINAEYLRRTKHSQEVGMPTDQYATSVVRQLTGRSPPRFVWEGFGAKLVRFASIFLPYFVMVSKMTIWILKC